MELLRENRPLTAAVAIGGGMTLLVSTLPFVRFAYDNPALHLALETGEGLIACLLAYLAVERYRVTERLQHALLAWVFCVLGFANLFMSAGPLIAERGRPGGWLTWATLAVRLVAIAALFAGAYAGARAAPPRKVLVRNLLALTLVTSVTAALGASAADTWLGAPLNPLLSPGAGSSPTLVGHPLVLCVQLLTVGLYGGAAAGFTRQAQAQGDELLRWLGAGSALGAFARVNYLLFPSLYSNFVYSGDLLRLGSYLFFLVGAIREIDAYWRNQTRLAAVEERRRVARDLHDGLAQELAFIRSQTSAMAAGTVVPGMMQHLSDAADRALAESRRAVDVLSGGDVHARSREPLVEALTRAAEEVARRAGAVVKVEVNGEPAAVSMEVHEALVRVTREAATNAVRHGGASTVALTVSVENGLLRLLVSDNGTGFDPGTVRRGHGLRGMRERAEALGTELRVESAPGDGTAVELELLLPPVPRHS
ncbi:MAG TPA: sensor histidine kinase [Acidimicrobiales bacterium]|nr:sensor histidine kinase [Acidimicrobiales bacterium]